MLYTIFVFVFFSGALPAQRHVLYSSPRTSTTDTSAQGCSKVPIGCYCSYAATTTVSPILALCRLMLRGVNT
jgi:hypothetical protein